ncbi:MAG: universal stress protein [Flavobacteriales bacterium]
MQHIALLTDLSADSLHAARYAIKLFGTERTRYTAVHAYMDAYVGDAMIPMPAMAPELVGIAEEGLRIWAKQLQEGASQLMLEQRLVIGGPVKAARDVGHDANAEMVVVGRSGKGGSAFFGSSAVDVMKRSRVPVLVVPKGTPIERPTTILLADDHEEIQAGELAPLRALAITTGASIVIAHVEMEVPEGSAHWSDNIYELALADVPHTFLSAPGTDVADGLLRLAKKEHAQLVAMLHRHLDLLARLLHPSTTKDVLLHVDKPLLVLQQVEA